VVRASAGLAELRLHVDLDRRIPPQIQAVVHVRQAAGTARVVAHLRPIGVIMG